LAVFGSGIATADTKDNPFAPYIKKPPTDVFNARLTDEQKSNPKPVRGGELIRRSPVDFEDLNPITSTGADARYASEYMLMESLARRDAQYLEFVPWLADWWTIHDIIYMADGSKMEGLITSHEGDFNTPTKVMFREGAKRLTVNQQDCESVNDATGEVVLKDGRKFRGDIIKYHYTLEVADYSEAKDEVEIPLDKIGEMSYTEFGMDKKRKQVNKSCIMRFHLRTTPAATWHDGQPIVPQDFLLAFNTIRNPMVDGASLRVYYEDSKSLTIEEGGILQFEYNRPYFKSFTFASAMIALPSHVINYKSYEGDDAGYADYFNKLPMYKPGDAPMVGNGPYRRVRWNNGVETVLERYDDYWASKVNPPLPYWDPQRPYLDRIVYRVINDHTASKVEMDKGAVDADFDVEQGAWVNPENNTPAFTSRFVRASNITPSYTYVGWQMNKPLFSDKRVRQALTLLMDRETILRDVHYGLGSLQPSALMLEGPVHDPDLKPWPYDPDEGKKLLRAAGWADRDGDGVLESRDGQKFEFTYLIHNAREYHAKIADIVKENYAKFGIAMNIEKIEWAQFSERAHKQEFDAIRFAWATDYLDPDEFQIFHSSQAKPDTSNMVNYKSQEADQLMEQNRLTFEFDERVKRSRKLERIIWDDSPYTFLFSLDELYFYSTKFRNVRFYVIRPGYDYTEWYVDPEYKP